MAIHKKSARPVRGSMRKAPRKSSRTSNGVRLTSDVVPTKYEIHLQPDLEAFVFQGEETIHLSLKRPTKALTLHATELEITSAEIDRGSEGILAKKIIYNEKVETTTLTFNQILPKGGAKLTIAFRGVLNNRMHGFYRSAFQHEGKEKRIATTQFESTDARRAFPCFDEPAMKAMFEVSLTVPEGSTAISNTVPTLISEHSAGYKTVAFAPTPLMSTYLLAFIVGDFEHVEKKTKDGVLVRVFTTPGKKKQAQFALDCAVKIVSFFNRYFDIPYPLPVLDMIAIPDFSAGAMENWGAITYRESALLVDEEQSSTMNKQWVALVIAHEIAHQWFGNLVTMEWWTHLWLNEGFASYIEYLAVDHIFPKWDIWTQFLNSDHGVALHYDGLKNTHPIEVEVHHPAEIASVFDAVSYSKGASIIRMIADYLGEKTFRDGLRHYLKTHAYKNTATEDLWRSLEKVSGKPVAKIMANWTGKPGYPLITVVDKGKHYELRQSRFFASPISEESTRDTTMWKAPIVTISSDGKSQKVLLDGKRDKIKKGAEKWLKINSNESSVLRVHYSRELLGSLEQPIKSKQLKTRDRLGLIRDVFALTENGKYSTTESLMFARNYLSEDEYVVWSTISGGLGKLHSIFAHEPLVKLYEEHALGMFVDIGRKISWTKKPKSHSDALLKVLVLEALGKYGDKKTITKAQQMFGSTSLTINRIPADLRGVVYSVAAKYGGVKEYSKLLKMYRAETLHEEKNRIGRAMGNFKQQNLLQKTLNFAISKKVRPQDSVRMIGVVATNPEGTELAWKFLKKNWRMLHKRYQGSRELSYLLEPMGVSTSLKHAKDIEQFCKKNPTPGAERTESQVLERIHSNAAWLKRDRNSINSYLA